MVLEENINHTHKCKMLAIVDILTFTSKSDKYKVLELESNKYFAFQHFSVYKQLKFHVISAEHEESFITSGPGLPAGIILLVLQ